MTKIVFPYKKITRKVNFYRERQFLCSSSGCHISFFYIKPQPHGLWLALRSGCLISLFYIKPQHMLILKIKQCCCLISLFYIKPQPWLQLPNIASVVLYRYSTSNHNLTWLPPSLIWLSYIVILHQTTTIGIIYIYRYMLSYIVILHQTTTKRYTVIK